MNIKCKQSSLSAAGQLYASKPLLQVVYFFRWFQWQAQALVYCIITTLTEQETRMERLWWEGDKQINTHTDFATTRPTRPRGPSWWKLIIKYTNYEICHRPPTLCISLLDLQATCPPSSRLLDILWQIGCKVLTLPRSLKWHKVNTRTDQFSSVHFRILKTDFFLTKKYTFWFMKQGNKQGNNNKKLYAG